MSDAVRAPHPAITLLPSARELVGPLVLITDDAGPEPRVMA